MINDIFITKAVISRADDDDSYNVSFEEHNSGAQAYKGDGTELEDDILYLRFIESTTNEGLSQNVILPAGDHPIQLKKKNGGIGNTGMVILKKRRLPTPTETIFRPHISKLTLEKTTLSPGEFIFDVKVDTNSNEPTSYSFAIEGNEITVECSAGGSANSGSHQFVGVNLAEDLIFHIVESGEDPYTEAQIKFE